jgi:hypothetical protein
MEFYTPGTCSSAQTKKAKVTNTLQEENPLSIGEWYAINTVRR